MPSALRNAFFFFFSLSIVSAFVFPLQAARVEQFSPQGTVKGVRQVTARFSEPMVTFGDPRLEDPFSVQCPEKGRGRWLDSRNWVYDFDGDLPGGLTCSFRLKDALTSLKGEPMEGPALFSFDTGGPAVVEVRPEGEDREIDENQVFILTLDTEADESSVLEKAYWVIQGIKERVGVRILKGEERERLFKALRLKEGDRPLLVLQARQTFPAGATVKLIWGKGIRSRSGLSQKEDQVLTFKTRRPFTAEFKGRKEKPGKGVIPLLPMKVVFSSPVVREEALKARLKGPGGKVWKAKAGGEGERPLVDWIYFDGPFPEKSELILELPKGLKDESGRPLANRYRFPMKIQTDRYPSLAKFPGTFGILELKEGGVLPVTVRNLEAEIKAWMVQARDSGDSAVGTEGKTLTPATRPSLGPIRSVSSDDQEKIIRWLRDLKSAKREASLLKPLKGVRKMEVPKELPSQETEVVGLPLKEPGFYLVELESEILGSRLLNKPSPMYVAAAALVTNLAVHFKWGRASSLAWVTTLDKGEPVAGAEVTVRDCTGRKHWSGKTDPNGLARISASLPDGASLPTCRDKREMEEYSPALAGMEGGLFVFARLGPDMTLTHSSWNAGIEPWRFNVPFGPMDGEEGWAAHTVFDRTLFRAGETVHMKHILRRLTPQGIGGATGGEAFREAVIEHDRTGQKYVLPLTWRPNGTAESMFLIPESAKLGSYSVRLVRRPKGPKGEEIALVGGSFRVEEFRLPLMQAVIQGPKTPLVRAQEIPLDLSVRYLAGGGAAHWPVKVRSELSPRWVSFPDYEEYVLANGRVKAGVFRYGESEFGYGEEETEEEGAGESSSRPREKLETQELVLDEKGGARVILAKVPLSDAPKDLLAEVEFRDPNGEIQTVSARIPLYPAEVLVGLQSGSGEASQSKLKYSLVVLDLKGRPLPGVEAEVRLFSRKSYSYRRRLAGGFYAYEHIREIKEVGRHCRDRTDSRGMVFCEGPSPVSGSVILQAEVWDKEGRSSFAHQEMWVSGQGDLWDEARNDDRMDLIPEKRGWEVGEQAVFQVKMPFRQATLLVTVEREGILDAYIRRITRDHPVVMIPVREEYAPNVFVSALAVRGRLPGTQATAFFDPGKPAYKLGLTEIRVGWGPHALKVDVSADKEVYRPREKVRARIKVRVASGHKLPLGAEAAVAVVDEGLLELKANDSWDLLAAMMRRRNLSVETATAQMMVVGKRHFGRKALRQGGGGGRQLTRELFDTLVHWQGVVPLNEQGEAVVEFPLNDSLTSFRITAVALAGNDLFGSGGTSIRTHQDLMIFSGLPPLVREEDRFRALFTVRNATEKPMDVEALLSVTAAEAIQKPPQLQATLPPGGAQELGWEVTVPSGKERLEYEIRVKERGGTMEDRLLVRQKVIPAVPERVFQAALHRMEGPYSLTLEKPREALSGKGGIQVTLKARLGEGLTGVKAYFKDYPYSCLEQKVSRAVVLKDEGLWKSLTAALPVYMDETGLVKYFPGPAKGSDILTAYLLSVTHEAGLEIPPDLRKRMINGLKAVIEERERGYPVFRAADQPLRKLAALEALSRYGAAEKGLFAFLTLEPQLWPNSALLDWINILTRVKEIPQREARLAEARRILRARLHQQGTVMDWAADKVHHLWWLMSTPDGQSARALLTALDWEDWKEEHPRMLSGLLRRMRDGHWDSTTANAWGWLAVKKFSDRYERTTVRGRTVAVLSNKKEDLAWEKTPLGRELFFAWPVGKAPLTLTHEGTGVPWAMIRSLAAVPLKQPLFNGFTIRKTLLPLEKKNKNQWSRGDLVRIRLELESTAEMTWVALSDPIPAGAMILGGGLGRDSALLTQTERERGWAWEAYRERSFEGLRVYYEYVPQGKWVLEYTVRLNQEGDFSLPPTRIEALYAPEMFGERPNPRMEVKP